MSIVWSYWELKPGTDQNKIAYYDLIWRTVLRNIDPKTRLILLTPENIQHYLPWIHPMTKEVPHIAQRVDYLRVAILYHYGGMWIDLDTLLVKDLEYFLHLGKSYPFIAVNYSVDHYDHESYFWVHDPLMVSEKGGKVITSFYNLFNEYFDLCEQKELIIRDMRYDQSSRLLTRALKNNTPQDYLLLAHNDLDKIPQHLANLWFRPFKELRRSEREILEGWSQHCKINICGSAHLNVYIKQHFKQDLSSLSSEEFFNYLFGTSLGYLLKKAGIDQQVDGLTFQYKELTGLVCSHRKIILIDSLHGYNTEVRLSLFYKRDSLKTVNLEDLPLEQYTVLTSVDSLGDYEDLLNRIDQTFPKRDKLFCFPIEELKLSVELIAEQTKSICIIEDPTIRNIDNCYTGKPYQQLLPHTPPLVDLEDLTDLEVLEVLEVLKKGGENQQVSNKLPFLSEEIDYLSNKIESWSYQDGEITVYETFSRGIMLAIVNNNKVIDYWHLANLVVRSDRDRFVYSNSTLKAQQRINCNNDVFIEKWPSIEIVDKEIKVSIELVFDRYIKKSRYDGFYKRFRLPYTLNYNGEKWTVFPEFT